MTKSQSVALMENMINRIIEENVEDDVRGKKLWTMGPVTSSF